MGNVLKLPAPMHKDVRDWLVAAADAFDAAIPAGDLRGRNGYRAAAAEIDALRNVVRLACDETTARMHLTFAQAEYALNVRDREDDSGRVSG